MGSLLCGFDWNDCQGQPLYVSATGDSGQLGG